jgi:Domain of unknown function (DUF5671)
MARNLYRLYLYIVFIAMLVLAAVGLDMLLQPLFTLTPLRGSDTIPSNSVIVQAVVFALVSWLIAITLGGLHYWLIRRDMQGDPAAGSSAVRSFFLNATEAISLPVGVVALSSVIGQIGQANFYGIPGSLALAIPALGLFTLVEWERRRTPAAPGAAIVFQRLHLYGVQLVLLLMLAFSWLVTINQLLDSIVFGGKGYQASCGGITDCPGPNLLGATLSTLWLLLFWIGYGLLSRKDTYSLLRQIIHFLSFAYGVGYLLYGVERGIELILRALLGVAAPLTDITGPSATYDFVPLISLGLLIVGVYGFWLNDVARHRPAGRVTTFLVAEAITTALLAVSFWWGVGNVLVNAMESIANSHPQLNALAWANAFAFVITGLPYIALDIYLRRLSIRTGSTGPRRGFVFILLGSGMLVAAIGAVVLLYNVLTSLLGSPLGNWQSEARDGAAALIVGVLILGIYFWAATREHLLGMRKPVTSVAPLETLSTTATAPVSAQEKPAATALSVPAGEAPVFEKASPTTVTEPAPGSVTIEDILDELQAGKITRYEAAARIRKLA